MGVVTGHLKHHVRYLEVNDLKYIFYYPIVNMSGGMEVIIKLQQNKNKLEPEITVSYAKMDHKLNRIICEIRQYEHIVYGTIEDKSYEIPLEDIIYFDCTEGRTFFYTQNGTYECKRNLITLEKELAHTTVLRIQKNCLLNMKYLRCVSPYPNHRLLAEMSNGEKLIISRKYIPDLKNMGREEML